MSAANHPAAVDSAAEVIASRWLIADLIDPEGPPCVVLADAEGRPIKVLCEADDNYEAEVALAEREQRENRASIRRARIESAYVKELLEEAAAAEAIKDPAPGTPARRFASRVPDLNGPRTKWIVKHIVPETSQVMIYGRHGTGKSTLAIEMGVHVALGKPWHGRKVKRGRVVYIASENTHGFRARLDALLKDMGITPDDLDGRFLENTGRPHLLKPDEVTELIKELKPLSPSLIFVDTMARATAGADENATKEMGLMIENCETIMRSTGASVVLIHHTGKDASKGARGSSAIPGAVDAEIYLERPDETENVRIANIGKMRDGPDYFTLFRYRLDTVQLGVDEDGDKITSTVVREIPPAPEALTIPELSNSPTRCAIRDALGNAQRAMPFEEMIAAAITKLAPPDPGTKDRRRTRIRQTAERMVKDRELHVNGDGLVSLLDPAMPFTPVPDVDANAASPSDDLVSGGVA